MKRTAIVALLVVTILVVALAGYCTTVIATARRETPTIVEEIVSSDRIKLRLEDFPPDRLEMLLMVHAMGSSVKPPRETTPLGMAMGARSFLEPLIHPYWCNDVGQGSSDLAAISAAREAYLVLGGFDGILLASTILDSWEVS